MKPADTDVPIHVLLSERWSPRSFCKGKRLAEDIITSLFEAARWAPSSFNEQPWRYLYSIHGTEAFDRMNECLNPTNRVWAVNASLLVLSLAKNTFTHNGKENRHSWHDVGAADLSMVLQALSAGLYCHQMAGFDKEKTKEIFEISEDFQPVTFIAIGYRDDPSNLPEQLKIRELAPRSRKSLEEIVRKVE